MGRAKGILILYALLVFQEVAHYVNAILDTMAGSSLDMKVSFAIRNTMHAVHVHHSLLRSLS